MSSVWKFTGSWCFQTNDDINGIWQQKLFDQLCTGGIFGYFGYTCKKLEENFTFVVFVHNLEFVNCTFCLVFRIHVPYKNTGPRPFTKKTRDRSDCGDRAGPWLGLDHLVMRANPGHIPLQSLILVEHNVFFRRTGNLI